MNYSRLFPILTSSPDDDTDLTWKSHQVAFWCQNTILSIPTNFCHLRHRIHTFPSHIASSRTRLAFALARLLFCPQYRYTTQESNSDVSGISTSSAMNPLPPSSGPKPSIIIKIQLGHLSVFRRHRLRFGHLPL